MKVEGKCPRKEPCDGPPNEQVDEDCGKHDMWKVGKGTCWAAADMTEMHVFYQPYVSEEVTEETLMSNQRVTCTEHGCCKEIVIITVVVIVIVCRLSFVVCRLSFVVCRLSFVVCRLSFVVCRLSFVVCRHLSFVVCRLSFIIYDLSFMIYHL